MLLSILKIITFGLLVSTTFVAESKPVSKSTVTWSKDNLTKTTTYLYSDKTKEVASVFVEPTVTIKTAGAEQITTTVYGNKKKVVTKLVGERTEVSVSPDYKVKRIDYVFLNGDRSSVAIKLSKSTVTWSKDNLTKTTTYLYSDKTKEVVVVTGVPVETRTFAADELTETIRVAYPNGKFTLKNVKHQISYGGVDYERSSIEFDGVNITGSSPYVTPKVSIYPTGTVRVVEDGSAARPFTDKTLVGKNIQDSNSFVRTDSEIYDLRWGAPDAVGPLAVLAFSGGVAEFGNGTSYFSVARKNICDIGNSNSCLNYSYPTRSYVYGTATINAPHKDVLQAWSNGWTGLGQNILVIDSFGQYVNERRSSDFHGVMVTSIAGSVAIRSPLYTYDWAGTESYLRDMYGNTVNKKIILSAVNMSFTTNSTPVAVAIANRLASSSSAYDASDAVITKAAGNDGKDAKTDVLNVALISNQKTLKNLILVGATQSDGEVNNKTSLAGYSNKAGNDSVYQNRFLVANGNSVYAKPVWIDGTYVSPGAGTSYAAPRVAGYAAILRQKFPNLNGAKSANILLDTARYDTLDCHPRCSKAIYGRGEASLSGALSPIGKLR
jgi:hypothetical protein